MENHETPDERGARANAAKVLPVAAVGLFAAVGTKQSHDFPIDEIGIRNIRETAGRDTHGESAKI